MNAIILGLSVVLALAAPKLWARYIFYKYSILRKDLPHTGGDLVRRLRGPLRLVRVQLKRATHRSHYNVHTETVHLSETTMNTRSLTALVRAAFEIGHALQHKRDAPTARFRVRLLWLARLGEKFGSAFLLASPLVALPAPPLAVLLLFVAIVSMLTGAAIHLVVLPIEWQAAFRYALPLLHAERYIGPRDREAVTQLMTACACSQLAYALANLLDGRHWLKALGLWRSRRADRPGRG